MAGTQSLTRPYAHWPKTALRAGFGVIWLIDAVLKWLPGFRSGYMDTIMGQAQGQPGWLKPWFGFWINLQHPRAEFFAYDPGTQPPPREVVQRLAAKQDRRVRPVTRCTSAHLMSFARTRPPQTTRS